jgi:hypothetical protein
VSEGGDIVVPKGGDAMFGGRPFGMPMSILRVLQGLPRKLVRGTVILHSVLLGNVMGVRRDIVQFGRALMVFVMRSVVVSGRHNYRTAS